MVIRRHRVHGRGGDRRLNEERGHLQVLCLLLHVLIHFLLWCYDSSNLMLKFQALIHEMVYLKYIMDLVIPYLKAFPLEHCWSTEAFPQ